MVDIDFQWIHKNFMINKDFEHFKSIHNLLSFNFMIKSFSIMIKRLIFMKIYKFDKLKQYYKL